jgi:O-antigen/teichoic acid export membrane protein
MIVAMGQIARIFGTFALLLVVARNAERDTYASIVLLIVLVNILSILTRCGLPRTTLRFVADATAHSSSASKGTSEAVSGLLAGLALALLWLPVLGLVLIPAIAERILEDSNLSKASWTISAIVVVEGLQLLLAETFRGFLATGRAVTYGYAARSGSLLIGTLGLVQVDMLTFKSFAVTYLCSATLICVIATLSLVRLLHSRRPSQGALPLRPIVSRVPVMLAVGLAIAVAELASVTLAQGDTLVAGATLGPDLTAVYNASSRFANLLTVPYFIVTLALPPYIATMWIRGQRRQLERLICTGATFGTLPVLLSMLILAAAGPAILSFLFGPAYESAGRVVVLLAVGPLINAACGAASTVLTMVGHQREVMTVSLVATPLVVALEVTGSMYFGLYGLALASALGTAGCAVCFASLARRRLQIRTWTYVRPERTWVTRTLALSPTTRRKNLGNEGG